MPLDDCPEGLNVSNLHWCWRSIVNDVRFRIH
jgi:hypothetical protein